MVVSVRDRRIGQQVVVIDHLRQCRHPVVVVLPFPALGLGRVLPLADRVDQTLLEVAPLVMAEFRQRQRQPECPPLPVMFELRCGLVGREGFMQCHVNGPASATSIIVYIMLWLLILSSV